MTVTFKDKPLNKDRIQEHKILDRAVEYKKVNSVYPYLGTCVSTTAYDLLKTMSYMVPDGETSTGHPRFRAMENEEAVKNAFDVAEAYYIEGVRRGWILEMPSADELEVSTKLGFTPT
jgi:hypothetical protein